MPVCAYCKKERELCASHAIPDGLFRLISRRNSGKLIAIPTGDGNIHFSNDTGKAKLLCIACEALFNRDFDAPLVNALKAWDSRIVQEGFGVRFRCCPNHIAQGLASIFWRASVSENDLYKSAKVSSQDRVNLLRIMNGPRPDALKLCSCSIQRLSDKRPSDDGGISQEIISQIILPATSYHIGWDGRRSARHFAFAVVMQGFLCWLIIPRLPHAKRNKPGFLKSSQLKQHAPTRYFLDYEPLADAMVSGLKKHLEGKSKI